MDIEDIDLPNSWISIRAIREAADIRSSLDSCVRYQSLSSSTDLHFPKTKADPISPCNSLVDLQTQSINNSFNNLNSSMLPDAQPLDFACSDFPNKHKNLSKLNEEIALLSSQLKQANEIIGKLTNTINENTRKHAIHIQAMQERQEQKAKKHSQDIKCIIKEFNSRNVHFLNEILINQHKAEVNEMRARHEQEIRQRDCFFQGEIDKNETRYRIHVKNVKNQCIKLIYDLKNRFLEELEFVECKFKQKMKHIWRDHRKRLRSYNTVNEDDSTVIEAENESESEELGTGYSHSQELASRMNFIFNKYKEELERNEIFQEL